MRQSHVKQHNQKLISLYVIDKLQFFTMFFLHLQQILLKSQEKWTLGGKKDNLNVLVLLGEDKMSSSAFLVITG